MTKTAIFLLAVLFLVNTYIGIWESLGGIFWISVLFHFLGGLFTAMLIFSFYNSDFAGVRQYLRFLFVVAATMSVGVFWELLEFAASQLLTPLFLERFGYHIYFMGNLADTMTDLAMDTVGALVFVSSLALFKKGNAAKEVKS